MQNLGFVWFERPSSDEQPVAMNPGRALAASSNAARSKPKDLRASLSDFALPMASANDKPARTARSTE